MSDCYLIWSNEYRAWWRPNARGYTLSIGRAGRYTRELALLHCRVRDQADGEPLPEIPVRVEDLMEITIWQPARASAVEDRGGEPAGYNKGDESRPR